MRTVTTSATASLLLILAAVTFSSAADTAVSVPPVSPPQASSAATSVLEHFRTYTGQRTPRHMTALFSSREPGRLLQQPFVALSDGVTPLLVTIKADISDGMAPNFSSSGARFISAKRDVKGDWLIEVIPEAGSLQATVTVLANGLVTELPLVVAPPLPPGTDLGAAAFTAFLAGSGSSGEPLRDLNGDNILDYRDDYIFTANYLVKDLSDPHNLANRQRKALELTPKK